MNKYVAIMAGGGGTRFWPISRQKMPKQLLKLSGDDAMINETIKRVENLIPCENIYIVTNEDQAKVMAEILVDEFPRENILVEPAARDTSACILYASKHILETKGDGVISVLPADHHISESEKFVKVLEKAIDVADKSNEIVTIGIKPTFPSTGYGYIKFASETFENKANYIEAFVEKPNLKFAKEYIASGEYLWNSGMFFWKASVICDLFERFLPKLYNKMVVMDGKYGTPEGNALLKEVYPTLEKISVDYGIMERTDNALVIEGEFGWNDIGSWETLGSVFAPDENDNVIKATTVVDDTKGCVIYSDSKKMIATISAYNLVIVDTEDALLVADKSQVQNVKKIVEQLKEKGYTDLL